MIVHEDELTNHRMTWLVTLHGFLFAALGFASKDAGYLIPILGSLGILTSYSIRYHLNLAHNAINELVQEWEEKKVSQYDGPDVIGRRTTEGPVTRPLFQGGASTPKATKEESQSTRRKNTLLTRMRFPWFSIPSLLILAWEVVVGSYLYGYLSASAWTLWVQRSVVTAGLFLMAVLLLTGPRSGASSREKR
jgi:hypothetical protein